MFHPDRICEGPKPPNSRPCNTLPCNEHKKSNSEMVLSVDHQIYNQVDATETEVSLRIGGRASIFAGTRVRIKCPVKNFPK